MVAKISRQIDDFYARVATVNIDRQIETVIGRSVIDENDFNRHVQGLRYATSVQIKVTNVSGAPVEAGDDRKLERPAQIRPEPRDVHARPNHASLRHLGISDGRASVSLRPVTRRHTVSSPCGRTRNARKPPLIQQIL